MIQRLPRRNQPKQGFTLIEVVVASLILGLLSTGSTIAYKEFIKRSHKATIETQLRIAGNELSKAIINGESVSKANCLTKAGLNGTSNFTFTCSARDDDSNALDINALPTKDNIGVGGVLSFKPDKAHACVKSCDATGSGENAVLDIKHLSLSNNCVALQRNSTDRNCNCTNKTSKTCGYRKKCSHYARGWGWVGCKRVYVCQTNTRKVCETCTDVSYEEK